MSDRLQSEADMLSRAMSLSGHSDHFFVKLFGVAQSTVSRLRARKISKVRKYLDKMINAGVFSSDGTDGLDAVASALATAARGNPELAELLRALKNFVHNSMH